MDSKPAFLMTWYWDGKTGQSIVFPDQMICLITDCKAFEFEYAE